MFAVSWVDVPAEAPETGVGILSDRELVFKTKTISIFRLEKNISLISTLNRFHKSSF